MLAEALRLIQTTAQEAVAARVLKDIPGDGRRAWIQKPGGTLEMIHVPPALRAHTVDSIEDLVLYVGTLPDPSKAVVWHGESRIVAVLDDADRRDTVVLTLVFSDQFEALEPNAGVCGVPLDQRAFIRALRLRLGAPEHVVAPFRRLDWATGTKAHGAVGRGKESLGREIEAEVNGIGELPELLVLEIPIYRNYGLDFLEAVRVNVDADPGSQKLTLIPEPNAREQAIDRAQATIRTVLEKHLGKAKVPIYYGRP